MGLKTASLVKDSVTQQGLGDVIKTVTFDAPTVHALRNEPGSDEAKIFNLVRGLRDEIDAEPEKAPVFRPLKERAEHILEDLQNRNATSLVAMEQLLALAKEKEDVAKAAEDSGLSTQAFGVYWTLKKDTTLKSAGIAASMVAREAETLLARFPNASENEDEKRRLRSALYQPILEVNKKERARIVETILEILLESDTDAHS